MINNFTFASKIKEAFYWHISATEARKHHNDYNIYFNYYNPKIGTHIQEFDYYILDSEKTFDEQLDHIKTLCFPDYARYFFYTDYKTNKSIIKRKIAEAKDILTAKKKSFSVTNIAEITKIKKELIRQTIWEMENKNQGFLQFD